MASRSSVPRRRALGWTAAVAVPLVGLGAILVPLSASGAVDLPDKSPEELIEFAAASDVDALSGTIEQSSELGLPDLSGLTGATDSRPGEPGAADIDDLIELATGSHTAKVYLDGDRARLQVLDQLAERNVYVDGDAVWYVDSESQTATKLILPSEAELDQPESDPPTEDIPTPDQVLDQALAELEEYSEVTVGTDARVAGRDVYELIITPSTDDTLIGELRFAIDGENGTALAASVTARGASDPAFEVAFTQVDFSAPDAGVFAFEPADGITVTEKDLSQPRNEAEAKTDAADPVVFGEGWSSVVELPNSSEGGSDVYAGLDAEQLAMLESISTAVDGGRVVETSLVTVLITDDGRVLLGAVPPERLVTAAQTGR